MLLSKISIQHVVDVPADADPFSLWSWRYETIIFLGILATVYFLGWFQLRMRGHRNTARIRYLVSYFSGLFLIGFALISPIDTIGEVYLFSFHMIQHLFLMYITPPLLLLGRPFTFVISAIPSRYRIKLKFLFDPNRFVRKTLKFLTNPFNAFIMSSLILWGWHWPDAYILAIENDLIHDIEHVTMFLSGLFFFWAILGSPPQTTQINTDEGRVIYLLAGATQGMILGALITFSDTIIYHWYAHARRLWGITPLLDQQLAGIIMWFPGPIIYGVVALISFLKYSEEFGGSPASR